MDSVKVIAIVGPTASGKTKRAIELAEKLNTEIISADSRQFYRELPIGSGMPDTEELNRVKHHFIACRSVCEEYSAGAFARDARNVIDDLLNTRNHVIVCGGSGLYINSLLKGMDEFPEVTQTAREQVEALYHSGGIEAWQRELESKDPEYYSVVDLQNPARLRRALEICFSSGKPYSSFKTGSSKPTYPFLMIGIKWPKEELHGRIHERVDSMIKNGLEKEARSVNELRHLKALQTVGYKEYFDYFDGKTDEKKCIELIKTHTRQYAKRQLTWFNNQPEIHWIEADTPTEDVLKLLN
jgi:tRNA dimethylallyltransferase